MGLQRSSQAVFLREAVLQGCLYTVVSVFPRAAELQGDLKSVGSVVLHATEPPGGLQNVVLVSQLPCVQRNSWGAFKLWCLHGSAHTSDQLLSVPVCSGSSGMSQCTVSSGEQTS